jgi:hypothetical protein
MFLPGQQYLVFLRMDQGRGEVYAALAFHVSGTGVVERVIDSHNGPAWPRPSNLIGRELREVVDAFSNLR